MLNPDTRPSSIKGIKRLATQIKKTVGIPHHEALDLASRAASFRSFPLAHKALVRPAEGYLRFQLFLTFYWTDRETYRRGRETLEIWLSRPLLDLCSKAEMKMVSGLANMRLVAPDHLVTDMMGQSQEFSRGQILKSVRALRFIEATGLRPCGHEPSRKAKASLSEELPDHDHDSDWYDPVSGHYVMIDEPYSRPVVSSKRAAWARVNGWHIEAARWPGIYFPNRCAFFRGGQCQCRFRLLRVDGPDQRDPGHHRQLVRIVVDRSRLGLDMAPTLTLMLEPVGFSLKLDLHPCTARADVGRIRQAILALVDNASINENREQ